MRRLVDFGVRRRALVIVVAVAAAAVGLLRIGDVEAETLPEFQATTVEVQTEALGLSAREVEELITAPLEADLLNGVAWLQSIRSSSIPGLSSIVLEFEPGTDILDARQVVQERLTQAGGLPNVSRAPAMVQPLSSENRVMMIGLSSRDVSLIDMSVLARWTIRPALLGIQGVANVSIWGQRERQLQVHVDQEGLETHGATLLDVVKTTGNALWVSPLSYLEASTPGTGGFIDSPNQRIGIQHALGIRGAEDLSSVAVEGHDDLILDDVATVVEDHQPLIGDALLDEEPGLLLVLEKFPWSNTVETTRAIDAALQELAPGLSGIDVETHLFRPADYLERAIDNVQMLALLGLALLAAVLLILLSGWRLLVLAAAPLLVSIGAGGLLLWAMGIELDAMILGGLLLAVGLIVDDSVGGAETIGSRLAGRQDREPDEVVRAAVQASLRYAAYATAALALGFLPSLAAQGAAGQFLPSVGLTAIAAVLFSMLVASVFTPALATTLLPRSEPRGDTWLMSKIRSGYDLTRGRATRSRAAVPVATTALVVAGALSVPAITPALVPEFQQTDVVLQLDEAPGTSLTASRRILSTVSDEVGQVPGVQQVGVHVGRAVLSDSVTNVNSNQLWVRMSPDASRAETLEAIEEVIGGYPGLVGPGAATYTNGRVDELLRRPTDDLVVRVYGDNPDTLGDVAAQIAELVAGVEGTQGVNVDEPPREPAVRVEVDLERAAEYNVKPGDVRRTVATLFSGIEVGSFFEDQKVFEVVVWTSPEDRHSVSDVGGIRLDTPSGRAVAVSEVADVTVAPAQNDIRREGASRYIDVVADLSGTARGPVADAITTAVEQEGLPFGYHVAVLDGVQESTAIDQKIIALGIAAAVTILLLLQAAFSSWRLALLLTTLPLVALSGGLVAVALGGGTISLGSWIGLAAVWAITLRHGLALVGSLEELQLDLSLAPGRELASTALRERLAPTVASLTAVLAVVLPAAAFGQSAGTEILAPLSAALAGGLITSALVTLFILPAAYTRFARPAVEREAEVL